ncbi:LPXTG cell wall anchor domain-containing protein [Bacillus marasmi]|uniref:LPXTG cell wall anchor domain-containing protein n=1 Tax=Bacillus marasmi TaxID=1926279 RepID=UPI0011C839B5|nr:LPXTG cell wall anchor domain-containing protein [Bacillus marasmi]
MKKRISFVSGLTALVFFLLTFTSSAFAAEVTTELDSISSPETQEILTTAAGETNQLTGVEEDTEVSIDSLVEGEQDSPADIDPSLITDIEDVYESTYGNVYDDVYEDVYENVYNDVYEDVYDDVYEDVYDGEYDIEDEYYNSYYDAFENAGADVYGYGIDLSEAENGTITFDATDSPNSNQVFYIFNSLSEEEITNIPAGLIINSKVKNLEISLPSDILQGYYYELSIFKDKASYDGALSDVFDLFLYNMPEGELISQFDKAITLKFKIDPAKVKNWDDVKLVYINTKGEKAEFIKPKSFDKVTGELIFEVTHFSKYGVFEIASAGSNNNGGGTTTTPTPTTGTTVTPGTTTTGTTTAGTGSPLPNTATDSYNMLIAGLAFIAVGGVFLALRKKPNFQ